MRSFELFRKKYLSSWYLGKEVWILVAKPHSKNASGEKVKSWPEMLTPYIINLETRDAVSENLKGTSSYGKNFQTAWSSLLLTVCFKVSFKSNVAEIFVSEHTEGLDRLAISSWQKERTYSNEGNLRKVQWKGLWEVCPGSRVTMGMVQLSRPWHWGWWGEGREKSWETWASSAGPPGGSPQHQLSDLTLLLTHILLSSL